MATGAPSFRQLFTENLVLNAASAQTDPGRIFSRSEAANFPGTYFVNGVELAELLRTDSLDVLDERKKIYRLRRGFAIRGFSARHGAALAEIRGTDLGKVILAETTCRPMNQETALF